jgi:hypothetical protein
MRYRVKLAVKVPGNPDETQRRREAARALIGAHEGKDDMPARPGANYVAAVFSMESAAKAFRDGAPGAPRNPGHRACS